MKLTKEEKQILNWILGKIQNNVLNGEGREFWTTDESLIFSFKNMDELLKLCKIQTKILNDLK